MAALTTLAEGFSMASGCLMALIAALLWRHHLSRPSWGLRWTSAALACGAIINIFAPLLITKVFHTSAITPVPAVTGLLALMIGFGSLAFMVVGTQHFALRPPRRPVVRFLTIWLGTQILVLLSAKTYRFAATGDLITAALLAYASWLCWRTARKEPGVGLGLLSVVFLGQPLAVFCLWAWGLDPRTARYIATVPYAMVGLVFLSTVVVRMHRQLADELAARVSAEEISQATQYALHRSHAVKQALLQQAPIPMAFSPVIEGRTPYSYWNEAWYTCFGYDAGSKDGVGGADFDFYAAPGVREEYMRNVLSLGRYGPSEVLLRHASGETMLCVMQGAVIESDEGPFVVSTFIDITAQRANELRLRDFEAMVQNADDVIFFVDEGLITAANPAAERTFATTMRAFIGSSPVDWSPTHQPDGRASALAAQSYIAAARSGVPQRFLWQHRRADGGVFTAQVALALVEGVSNRLVAVLRDVTEERTKTEALARSEARFRAIIAVANTGAWEYHQSTNYQWCSPEYFTMLGLDPAAYPMEGRDDLISSWIDLLHPDDAEVSTQAFANYLQGGSLGMYETYYRMRHASGKWIWVWARGQTLRNPDGTLTDVTVGTLIDITQRKEAEQKLEELNQTLEAKVEERTADLASAIQRLEETKRELAETNIVLQAVIDTLPIRIFWKDRDSRYLGCNPVFARDTGRQTPSEIVGLYDSDLLPEQAERYRADDRQVMDSGQPRLNFEEPHTTPDGRKIWLITSKVPLSNASGNVIGVLGVYDDITARKQAELDLVLSKTQTDRANTDLRSALESLQRTQDELIRSEKLAALGSLVAGIAHELNTPIGNAVTVATTVHDAQVNIRSLLNTGLTRNALVDFIDTVGDGAKMLERNLHRAAELVTNFKQLAADQSSYQRREFYLYRAIEEVRVVMAPALRKAKVRLESAIPEEIHLDSYPGPLTQALMILVNNSLIHAFSGKEAGCIQIEATHEEAGWVTIGVSDDGSGIPSKHLSRIFEPFFTTKLGQGGSGLGLHIFFNIVSGVLAGRVSVDSSIDRGTRFTICIPISPPTARLNQFEV